MIDYIIASIVCCRYQLHVSCGILHMGDVLPMGRIFHASQGHALLLTSLRRRGLHHIASNLEAYVAKYDMMNDDRLFSMETSGGLLLVASPFDSPLLLSISTLAREIPTWYRLYNEIIEKHIQYIIQHYHKIWKYVSVNDLLNCRVPIPIHIQEQLRNGEIDMVSYIINHVPHQFHDLLIRRMRIIEFTNVFRVQIIMECSEEDMHRGNGSKQNNVMESHEPQLVMEDIGNSALLSNHIRHAMHILSQYITRQMENSIYNESFASTPVFISGVLLVAPLCFTVLSASDLNEWIIPSYEGIIHNYVHESMNIIAFQDESCNDNTIQFDNS